MPTRTDASQEETLASPCLASRLPRLRWAYWVASTLLYLLLTLWLYGSRVFDNALIVSHAYGDVVQGAWTLAWPAYAITHGHNPFFSSFLNYPHGINIMVMGAPPLLGIMYSPVTWSLGPVAAFMLAMRLGFVTSAMSAQWVATKLGISRPASLAAGILYGFSAEQIFQGQGHLYLVYVGIPPLILYTLCLLLQRRIRPWRAGALIGVLTSADFLISQERALMTLVIAIVALVVLAVMRPRSITKSLCRDLVLAGVVATTTALVLLYYPLTVFFGRGHFTIAHSDIQKYRADLSEYFLPGPLAHFSFLGIHVTQLPNFYWENGAYIGVPLLICLASIVVLKRHVHLVRFAVIMVAIAALLSLGSQLLIYGHNTAVPLPEGLLSKFSLLGDVVPSRYELYVWLFVSLLAAYGLDCAFAWCRSAPSSPKKTRSIRTTGVVICAGIIVLTLVPAGPYPTAATAVPNWLSSAEAHRDMPAGSVTLFYPYAISHMGDADHAMLDEAVSGFRYKIIGACAMLGDKYGDNWGVPPLQPLQLPTVFIREFANIPVGWVLGSAFRLPPLPPNDASTAAAFREFARRYDVTVVVVEEALSPQAEAVAKYLVRAFGAPNRRDGGTLDFWRLSKAH
ncbi:MAG: hypothetical protein WAV54_07785 [Acidimicrobiales bacterium]